EAAEGNDAFHFVGRADFILNYGEAVEDDHAGGFLGLLDGDVGGDFADDFFVAIDGQAAGKVEEVAGADAVHVGGDRGGDGGKREAERGDFFEDGGHYGVDLGKLSVMRATSFWPEGESEAW